MAKKKIIRIHTPGGSRKKSKTQVYPDSEHKDQMGITQCVEDFLGVPADRGSSKDNESDGLFHTIYDSVIMTDYEGNITRINPRAVHKFDIDDERFRTLNIVDILAGADVKLLDLLRGNIAKGKYTIIEAVCVKSDESRFHGEIIANALDSDQRDELCFFIRDINERKLTEEALKHANDQIVEAEKIQARIDTISTVVHELNNPLQVLMCLAEELEKPELSRQVDSMIEVLNGLRSSDMLAPIIGEDGDAVYSVASAEDLSDCDKNVILIVDDEDAIRKLFIDVISREFPDKTIYEAKNGQEAVDIFMQSMPSMIIMDVSMPVMDGKSAFNQIKDVCDANSLHIPSVIFCTAFVVSDELKSIIEVNPTVTCRHKPVTMSSLVKTVKEFMPA